MKDRNTKLWWLLLTLGIVAALGVFAALGCGDDDDDNDDSTPPADDTTTDDTTTDDTTDDATDDADDDTVATTSISGIATDFKQKTPLPGATVEAVNDADGASFDPPIVATADTEGYVLLEDIPSTDGLVGIKVSYAGYKDTYQYHFVLGSANETFLGISETLVTLISGLLGITADETKGFASGAVYYVNSDGEEEQVGCSHVTFDPEVAEVHYFKQSALGVIPTNERDWSAETDHNGEGTNPLLDDEGKPMSFFVGINADPGAYEVSADADGTVESSTIPALFANSVAITTVLYDSADYATNPTPTWCTE